MTATISRLNGIDIGDINTVNGITHDSISEINGITHESGFENTYSLKQTTSPYGGYVDIASPSSYHFESGGTDSAFSISLWIKPTYGASYWMVSKADTGKKEYIFGLWGSGVVIWALYSNDGGSQYIQQYDGVDRRSALADGNWHHLAATYDGSEAETGLTFYVDNSAVTAGRSINGYSDLNDSGGNLRIGGWATNSNTFLGYIDEVSMWNKELSAAEVDSTYNDGAPSDLSEHSAAANLLSWWRMGDNNGGTGVRVTDVQGVGNGTLTSFQSADGFTSTTVPGS